jgi:hypothetical protein
LQLVFGAGEEGDDEAFGGEAVGYCFADAWACAYDGDDGFVAGVGRHDGWEMVIDCLQANCKDGGVGL